jgi:hypothetical protein
LAMASAGRPLGVAGTERLREYQCCFFIWTEVKLTSYLSLLL